MSMSVLPAISVQPPTSDQPNDGEREPFVLTPPIAYSQPQAVITEKRRSHVVSMNMNTDMCMAMDTKPLPRIPRKPTNHTPIQTRSSISLESSTPATPTGDTSTDPETSDQSQTPPSSASPSLLDSNNNNDNDNNISHAPTVVPPLTRVHFSCYQYHRTFVRSRNTYYPLPCMTCLRADDKNSPRFRCTFCCLRICGDCVKGLNGCREKSLMVYMEELVKTLEGAAEKGV